MPDENAELLAELRCFRHYAERFKLSNRSLVSVTRKRIDESFRLMQRVDVDLSRRFSEKRRERVSAALNRLNR